MSDPLSTVVQTLDGPVLAVLARTTKPLTGRRVHQLAAAGRERGVRNVLHRLAETGLVDAVTVGPSVQYTLNRDHVAAGAVLELTALRPRLFNRFRGAIDAREIKPDHASIFGSTARSDGDLNSDIDLLVIHSLSNPPQAWDDQLGTLTDHAYRWGGNHLQTYALSLDRLIAYMEAGEPIINDWKRDAVRIHGPEIRTLINRLTQGESVSRPAGRTENCNRAQAAVRLTHARAFLRGAELVDDIDETSPTTTSPPHSPYSPASKHPTPPAAQPSANDHAPKTTAKPSSSSPK